MKRTELLFLKVGNQFLGFEISQKLKFQREEIVLAHLSMAPTLPRRTFTLQKESTFVST
jgi:hypothetical protein